jgi:predicted lipoprotein
MSVNLYELNQIKYQQAIAALEEFVEELVLEFIVQLQVQPHVRVF